MGSLDAPLAHSLAEQPVAHATLAAPSTNLNKLISLFYKPTIIATY